MNKRIALGIVTLTILGSFLSLAPLSSEEFKIGPAEKVAFKTEGACMSRILDKAPRIAAKQGCRLG
ncbi:hypothetical protein [Bdellovibrio sp. HCB209]|uniref:hypothetical protein n=1 Tax=Bdellovibrio sp. HCB209 TaxID=3394354 RepID=UPI0039B52EB3